MWVKDRPRAASELGPFIPPTLGKVRPLKLTPPRLQKSAKIGFSIEKLSPD
jgi:hypothetical protein